jgi:hypothetical protein
MDRVFSAAFGRANPGVFGVRPQLRAIAELGAERETPLVATPASGAFLP